MPSRSIVKRFEKKTPRNDSPCIVCAPAFVSFAHYPGGNHRPSFPDPVRSDHGTRRVTYFVRPSVFRFFPVSRAFSARFFFFFLSYVHVYCTRIVVCAPVIYFFPVRDTRLLRVVFFFLISLWRPARLGYRDALFGGFLFYNHR